MKSVITIICFFILGFTLTACGGASAATASPTAVPLPPTAAPTAVIPTPDISAYLQMDLSGGDPQQGFNVAIAYECQGCHAGVRPERGPRFTATDDLLPILERGELRIADPTYEGQAATSTEYLLESIFIPEAHLAPGEWAVTMPDEFAEKVDEEDLAHLLAWMETFGAADDAPAETSKSEVADEILAIGDPERGRDIFMNGGAHELYKPEYACATCHTLDGSKSDHGYGGPSLLGIATRAGDRVPGLADEEYIRQSIMDPAAYVAEGYGNKMSNVAIQWLTEEELDDLAAFLLRQESTDDIAPPPRGNPILEVEIDLGVEIAEGDVVRGRNAAVKYRCLGCHAEDNPRFGIPFTATEDLPHILQRGELRIADPAYKGQATTNLEYILESIFLPDVYILPGKFEDAMPDTYHLRMTETELANIIAWIESLE